MRFSEIRESIEEIHTWLTLSNKGLSNLKNHVSQVELNYQNNPSVRNRKILIDLIELYLDQIPEIVNDEIWDRINDPDEEIVKEEYQQFHDQLLERLKNL